MPWSMAWLRWTSRFVWYLNPTIYAVFQHAAFYEEIVEEFPLHVAPGLRAVLQAPEPPREEFFMTMPAVHPGHHLGCLRLVVHQAR